MLRISTGVDCEPIEKFRRLMQTGEHRRIFSPTEYAYGLAAAAPAETYAGIWCAKEATVKAVSLLVSLDARSVVVEHDDRNRPFVRIVGDNVKTGQLTVSISHTPELALAVALCWEDGSTK